MILQIHNSIITDFFFLMTHLREIRSTMIAKILNIFTRY